MLATLTISVPQNIILKSAVFCDHYAENKVERWEIQGKSNYKMLDELVNDYSAYLKLDVLNSFQTVQDVVDNMLTRLEELTSVLLMVKLKNSDCSSAVSEDISKYRSEITLLSKKITTLINVIHKLQNNVDLLEKRVDKAETDFGVNNDNKIKSFLKPFLKRNKEIVLSSGPTVPYEKLVFDSVLENFEDQKQ